MEHTLYRKLVDGEKMKAGDIWGNDGLPVEDVHVDLMWSCVRHFTVFRPVSVETMSCSLEQADEEIGLSHIQTDSSESEHLKTLREHYAGLAMQGLLAGNDEDGFRSRFDPKDGAEIAVEWADALIAALNKKEEAV